MSRYEINDPDHKIACPYDDTHMIMLSWMPYHLMKCRKNYVGNDYGTCPFNAHHEVPRPELRYHTANCPDRVILNPSLAAGYKEDKMKPVPGWCGDLSRPAETWTPPPSSEDWDEDDNFPKYAFENRGASPARKKPEPSMTAAEKANLARRNAENYKRTQHGLPPLGDDEPLPAEKVRAPQQAVQAPVYQMGMQLQKPRPTTTTIPTVYARSLAMAGIGRGRGANINNNIAKPPGLSNGHTTTGGNNQVKNKSPSEDNKQTKQSDSDIKLQQYLLTLGRGRGLGRGGIMPQPGNNTQPQPGRTQPTHLQPHTQPTLQQPQQSQPELAKPTITENTLPTAKPSFIVPKVVQAGEMSKIEEMKAACKQSVMQGQWSCSDCTFLNHPALTKCEMCESSRQQDQPANKQHTNAETAKKEITQAITSENQKADSVCSDSPDEMDADPAKEVRRLKKKLAQIDSLIRRQREPGAVLTSEEREKISKRKLIVYQLESMSLDG